MKSNNKVLIAMSGGVDSSVAAFILKSKKYDLIGAMMKLYNGETESGCCSISDAEDARLVAAKMGIPFYMLNFTDSFADTVIKRFINAYQNGLTPNPCIDCNRFMKFKKFLNRATELECGQIATGHYAIIEKDINGRFQLKKGLDHTKDQSYVLYSMSQSELSRTLLPLGALTKDNVREIALEQGFVNAKKQDSQDICFAPGKNYANFIENFTKTKLEKGNFINKSGQIIGEHKGIANYTIGQRKGLGLFNPTPLFVLELNSKKNTVTVGESKDLFKKSLTATDINLIPMDEITGSIKVEAKIRYAHTPAKATVWQSKKDSLHIEFDEPQRAISPGQAVVLYNGDTVIGGGTII